MAPRMARIPKPTIAPKKAVNTVVKISKYPDVVSMIVL